jgi:hypothetical protein
VSLPAYAKIFSAAELTAKEIVVLIKLDNDRHLLVLTNGPCGLITRRAGWHAVENGGR